MKVHIGILALVVSGFVHAGDVTGKVHSININKHSGWNGVMFQLVNDSGAPLTIDSSCKEGGTYALFRMETELDKALLSVLLTAKASGEYVRVKTRTCLTPPEVIAPIPEVEWMDLGKRG